MAPDSTSEPNSEPNARHASNSGDIDRALAAAEHLTESLRNIKPANTLPDGLDDILATVERELASLGQTDATSADSPLPSVDNAAVPPPSDAEVLDGEPETRPGLNPDASIAMPPETEGAASVSEASIQDIIAALSDETPPEEPAQEPKADAPLLKDHEGDQFLNRAEEEPHESADSSPLPVNEPDESELELAADGPDILRSDEDFTTPALLDELNGGAEPATHDVPEVQPPEWTGADSSDAPQPIDTEVAADAPAVPAAVATEPVVERSPSDITMLSQSEIEDLLDNSAAVPTTPEMDEVIGPSPEASLTGSGDDAVTTSDEGDTDDTILGPAAQVEPAVTAAVEPVASVLPKRGPVDAQVSGENLEAATTNDVLLSQDLLDSIISQAKSASPPAPSPAMPEPAAPVAAVHEAPANSAPPVEERPPEVPELDQLAAETEEAAAPAPRRVSRVHIPVERPLKVAASLTIGLVSMTATLLYLNTQRVVVPAYPSPQPLTNEQLARAERAYLRAAVSPPGISPVADAAGTSAGSERLMARYLQIQNKFDALPDDAPVSITEPLHAEIDLWLEEGRTHPRAPDMLLWKAALYTREHLPLGALRTYARLLDEYAKAPEREKALERAAQLCMDLGQPHDAIAHYDQLLREFPSSRDALKFKLGLADAKRHAGDVAEARELYGQLARVYYGQPIGTEAFGRLGELELDRGNLDEAITYLDRRLQTATSFEGNDRVHLLLARAYRGKGQFDQARAVLQDLIAFFPASDQLADAHIELSRTFEDLGQRDDALRVALQAKQSYPDTAAVHEHLASMFVKEGQYDSAAESYLEAASLGGDVPRMLVSAGDQFERIDRAQDALDAYNRVIREYRDAPEAIEAIIDSARVLKDAFGETREALTRLERAAAVTTDRPQRLAVLTALAEMYHDLGLEERAAAVFDQVAEMSREPETQAKAALALLRANRVDEGLAMAARTTLEQLPRKSAYTLLIEQARALVKTDPDRSLSLLERAHTDYASERTALGEEMLMDAYLAKNQSQRARALVSELRATAQRNPASVSTYAAAARRWGDFSYQRGDYRAAADAYGQLIDARGVDTDTQQWARFQKANALLAAGEFRESALLFDEVAASKTSLSTEAKSKAVYARLQLERRGEMLPMPSGKG